VRKPSDAKTTLHAPHSHRYGIGPPEGPKSQSTFSGTSEILNPSNNGVLVVRAFVGIFKGRACGLSVLEEQESLECCGSLDVRNQFLNFYERLRRIYIMIIGLVFLLTDSIIRNS
jgi:hypothetical protein